MRILLATALTALFALPASACIAQDIAAQQAQMASQQAAQQANQQAIQASQQAQQAAQLGSESCCYLTAAPSFSLAPGTYPGSTVVRLKTRARSATIFYTTDGWTPTAQSTPYTGPITLTQTGTIQAVAFSPGAARSAVSKAEYIISTPVAALNLPAPAQISPTTIEIPQNTPIPLVFTSKLDSQTASIGDLVPLALASDLVVNGIVIAPKGTPAQAKVTAVDPAGHASLPGTITFTLLSITVNGIDVTLSGTRTREGQWHLGRQGLFLIPVVGAASLLKHGDPAEIAPNTPVTGLVAANVDIPIAPGK